QKAQAKSVASPAEQDWLELMAKIATNSPLSKQLLGDDVNEENMNERMGVPQDVHAASSQVPVSVLAAPSIAAEVSVSTVPHDIAAVSGHVDTEVHVDASRLDDTQTASDESDDDPLPYAPYAGWEMVPTSLGFIHAYYDMEEHTKHFTSLRELLHMVEKNDLRKLLGASLADEDAHAFWRNQDSWRIRSWCLYPCAQVHMLETLDGWVIYMFVDVFYPLSAATLKRMLKHGLEVLKLLVGGDLTMAEQLVSFIKAALLNAQSAV
nr:hypothetical protein [Tanacetum cinerariifolium]